MITFGSIAATSASDAAPAMQHLMNSTLSMAEARSAAYYSRGASVECAWYDLAVRVVAGDIVRDEAVYLISAEWRRTWDTGDMDAYYRAHAKFEDRFDDILERVEAGLGMAPLAVIRPDIAPGVMLGLGLEPNMVLTNDEVTNLLAGRRVDGAKIEGKHYAVERPLPVDRRTKERKWSTPIGSYDFCATPDKSVSVAWAFAGPVEQARIFNAHTEAAREAVGYIADEIGVARLGKGGQEGTEPGEVAWLEFVHHTSRRVQIVTPSVGGPAAVEDAGAAGDPNLHTHHLVVNAVFTPSGRVGSLDTAAVRGLLKEAGAFYQARLGTKLRDQGFDAVLDAETGAVRLPIVPDSVRTHFSKRSAGGEADARKEVADAGLDWDALSVSERITRVKESTQRWETRQKAGLGQKDDQADFADWHVQAKDIGWNVPVSFRLIGPPLRELTRAERHRAAYEMALPWLAERFEHEAVLQHFDLRRAALRGLVHTGMSGLEDVDAVTKIMREDGVLQYGTKTPLLWGQEIGKRYVSVTTGLHEADEQEFVLLAHAAAFDKSGAIPPGLLRVKIETAGLDFADEHGKSQRAAIERIGTGGRFGVVLAAAGAGKSTALKPLVASWKEMQRDVYGASLAWRQADDMVDAGIDKKNVKAFSVLLKGLATGDIRMTENAVVAVDEWGLLGTRQGLELLRYRARMGFSIVALGDEKQCTAIEAGAIIDLSRRALGADQIPEILTTKRQETDREKEIAGLFRDGRAAEALDMKRSDGTAEMAYGGRDGVIARVAAIYAKLLAATGEAPTISAPTNSDAQAISAAVRDERRKMGLVGPKDMLTVKATDGTRDYSLRLAQGDKVRLFKNTAAVYADGKKGWIGRNGSVLEVMEANEAGVVLKTHAGVVGSIAWDKLRTESGRIMLAYGDAMTIHTSQGSTAKVHIFALPVGSHAVNGHMAYSAATRHKSVVHLVTSESAERIAVSKSRPINDKHDITEADKWSVVAKAFAWQPERDSALSMRDRVSRIKSGTVDMFLRANEHADPRLRPKLRPKHAPEIVRRRMVDIGLDAVRRGVEKVRRTVASISR